MRSTSGSAQTCFSNQARLSISLPKSLYRQFKIHAHEKDSTLSALIIQMIKAEIQCHQVGEPSGQLQARQPVNLREGCGGLLT
jgi:hypothetical protein